MCSSPEALRFINAVGAPRRRKTAAQAAERERLASERAARAAAVKLGFRSNTEWLPFIPSYLDRRSAS